jgi:hypothetical protein
MLVGVLTFVLIRPNYRNYEFVCKDTKGKYSIYSRSKPCLEKNCSFVALDNSTKRCYGLVIGQSPQLLNPPEKVEPHSISFNLDVWGGEFIDGPNGHHFAPVEVKGSDVHAVIGNSSQQEEITFAPLNR